MSRARMIIVMILIFAAGFAGVMAGNIYENSNANSLSLHDYTHNELQLDASQNKRLEALETAFHKERQVLEMRLKESNANLAKAMDSEHEYGPKVEAQIANVHQEMGALQKATIAHIFDMRAILTKEQQIKFDRKVSTALSSDPQ